MQERVVAGYCAASRTAVFITMNAQCKPSCCWCQHCTGYPLSPRHVACAALFCCVPEPFRLPVRPAGLMPHRSATRIMRSRCLASSFGFMSLPAGASGKKICHASFSFSIKSDTGFSSVAATGAFLRMRYLIVLPTAAVLRGGISSSCGDVARLLLRVGPLLAVTDAATRQACCLLLRCGWGARSRALLLLHDRLCWACGWEGQGQGQCHVSHTLLHSIHIPLLHHAPTCSTVL